MLATIRKVTSTRDKGASAVEYGLLVAAIAALVVIIVFALGSVVKSTFDRTCDEIGSKDSNANTPANCAS
jgi:pilus assembly protein Flp/PilA